MLPKAAYPVLCEPLPVTLGILATALPGPQEIAACLIPANGSTPLAYLEFLERFE